MKKRSIAEMREDDWLKVAWVEEAVVADLLLRLKEEVKPTPPPPLPETSPSTPPKQALLLEWRVRQRRSKAMMIQPKNRAPRCSPTTPLSFSGGATSVSGGGGGGIECGGGGGGGCGEGLHRGLEREFTSVSLPKSTPKSSDIIRSKVDGSSESKTTGRSRKKKLQKLADLKAEEELLTRERRQLQKELESVRKNLEKERARNHSFKRMKSQHMASVHHPALVASPPIIAGDVIHLKHSSVSKFLLPDLNLPLEE